MAKDIKTTICDSAREHVLDTDRNAEVVYLPAREYKQLCDTIGGTPTEFEGMLVFKYNGDKIQFGQRGGA